MKLIRNLEVLKWVVRSKGIFGHQYDIGEKHIYKFYCMLVNKNKEKEYFDILRINFGMNEAYLDNFKLWGPSELVLENIRAINIFCHLERIQDYLHRSVVLLDIDLLKYWKDLGRKWNEKTLVNILRKGDLDTVRYVLDNLDNFDDISGFRTDGELFMIDEAANSGSIHLIQFLRDRGERWSKQVLVNAAKSGNLNLVDWIKQDGFVSDLCNKRYKKITEIAVERQDLGLLNWCIKNSIPWSAKTAIIAIEQCNMRMLKRLLDAGCPLDQEEACSIIGFRGNGFVNILKFLEEKQVY